MSALFPSEPALATRPADHGDARVRTALFDALAAAGISTVVVEFDGSDDSGQIEAVIAHDGKAIVDLPATDLVIDGIPGDVADPAAEACPVAEAIEIMAYDLLRDACDGWENDDGAFGTFTFDVAARSIRLDYHERVMKTDYSEHVF